MSHRIIGIDVARALAVIGMIIVNFKTVLGENGVNWLKSFTSIFEGKAAATFVVLAGVGLALMTNVAIYENNEESIKNFRIKLIKRALFLFIVGTSYIAIWPADILHFYGVYLTIIILLLKSREKTILLFTVSLIMVFPILVMFWNYETGWNFSTLDYLDFWTFKGFIRNLFFNGFHPVIPWTAFMLFGFWFGKQDLRSNKFVKKVFWTSLVSFISIQFLSYLSISLLSGGSLEVTKELTEILGTNPMPPLPIYMFSGIMSATTVISACILIARRYENNIIIDALKKTGQLALTFYVAHIIFGMGIIMVGNPTKMGNHSIEFTVSYALVFSLLCILFAVIWRKYKKFGPLEWVMRKLTD